ncbi:MAG: hypothetical protein JKX85_04270 [Phycisphaeraceae bacterium]|nr:hypothetical protein [Phycisphaeraceae bacterium]
MFRVFLAVVFLALLIPVNSLLAAETVTQKLNEWCTVTYPDQVQIGQTVELTVAYKGLGKTKLYCGLHWKDTQGKKRGFMSQGKPVGDVQGDGEITFVVRVVSKSNLGLVSL